MKIIFINKGGCGLKPKLFATSDSLNGTEIKLIRKKLKLTQAEFADLGNISVKTVERWESGKRPVTGPIVTLVKILKEFPQIQESLKIPIQAYPIRLSYMYYDDICTIIDVDERERKVKIYNYTNDYAFRAFGRNETPTFEQYQEFLESRCFPRTRDKMKLILRELDLPFYEPFMIIEKTQGRMAEDNFWIKIERQMHG